MTCLKTKQGNNIKLDSIPKANVIAINPRATVLKIRKHKYGNLKIKLTEV
jgi:hypothetical protein